MIRVRTFEVMCSSIFIPKIESRGLEVARGLKGMTMGVQLGVLSHPLLSSPLESSSMEVLVCILLWWSGATLVMSPFPRPLTIDTVCLGLEVKPKMQPLSSHLAGPFLCLLPKKTM